MCRNASRLACPTHRQRGMILPITAVGMATLLGFAALALDVSHLFLNKTRLQNAVDAAALSAAKDLDVNRSTTAAEEAAIAAFVLNLAGPGNQELQAEVAGVQPTVELSATVSPFVAGSGAGPYVRVAVGGLDAATWFAGIVGVDQLRVGASAVAGPTPNMGEACNVIPVVVCGDPDADGFFGYEYGDEATLKVGSKGDGGKGNGKFDIGPGNFQLIELDGANGGNDIRDGMAGIGERCIDADREFIDTEPGNKVGPASSGIATRFQPCATVGGGVDCSVEYIKPDMVTTAGIAYEAYVERYQAESFDFVDPTGIPERRMVTVPMGKCTGKANGRSEIEFLGFGCFFLTRPMTHKGNEANLYGECVEGCGTEAGAPGPAPDSGAGMYKIVLFKDTGSSDS